MCQIHNDNSNLHKNTRNQPFIQLRSNLIVESLGKNVSCETVISVSSVQSLQMTSLAAEL